MRNTMNIYKRKDGRFEGRIPLGYDDKGKIKYRYLYAKSLAEIKEKMLYAYTDSGNPERIVCDKTFKELCEEWLTSACGMVAVFCGVTNCPLTSLLLSIEMFGSESLKYCLLCIALSYLLSGYYSLYNSQKIMYSKYRTEFINRHSS